MENTEAFNIGKRQKTLKPHIIYTKTKLFPFQG